MMNIVKAWIDRYFAEEETVALSLILVVVLVSVIFLGNLLAPIIASLIIAYLLQGIVVFLNRWMPHIISVAITFVVFLGLALTTILLALPVIGKQFQMLTMEFPNIISKVHGFIAKMNMEYPDLYATLEIEKLIDYTFHKAATLGQSALTYSIETIPNLFAVAIYMVLIPILVFFFLKDKDVLLAWFSRFLPERRPFMRSVWQEMNQQIANYARGKAVEVIVVGSSTMIAFALMHQNYAVLLGVLVGLSVIVPYIGAVIVTIPVTLIGFFQWGWTDDFFYVMLVYLVVQFLDGNVLVPLLFSEAVNLHPIAIVVAILMFGGIWGLWGVFFAIPLATLIKALIEAWPKTINLGSS